MKPALFEHPHLESYSLLDSGEESKLERFGDVVLERPDPQALWRRAQPDLWSSADLRFERESDRGGRWFAGGAGQKGRAQRFEGRAGEWAFEHADARFLLRPTPFKHVGLFPEQATNWEWIAERASSPAGAGPPRLLNLFGYTGVASLLASRAGYDVTHVDASKASLAWMRDNQAASGMENARIRLVLEDALSFARREARRGSRYRGILLDPPHYGRGPKGETWQFESGIATLLETAAELLDERAFLILSVYAMGTSPLALSNLISSTLPGGDAVRIEAGELALPEEHGERLLPCGFCARWERSANP